jgi:outer membrane protein assembly factor BamA
VPGSLFLDDDGDGAPDLFPARGSLYARQFPAGEPGLASVVQAGVAIDTRDNEPAPRRGFFVDGSVRGAAPVTGSAFTFGGGDITARLFTPLSTTMSEQPIVLAQRTILDVVVGDAPVRERMRFGGLVDAQGLGGQDTARGVRLSRYPGRFRASHQIELRADVLHVAVGENDLGVVVAGFLDGAVAVFEASSAADDLRVLLGGGGSLRVVWNTNFVFRIDLALSPEEPGRLGFYTAPNHPF